MCPVSISKIYFVKFSFFNKYSLMVSILGTLLILKFCDIRLHFMFRRDKG